MKRLIAFFTSNLGLKLLALVLAIIVFYAVRDGTREQQLFNPSKPERWGN